MHWEDRNPNSVLTIEDCLTYISKLHVPSRRTHSLCSLTITPVLKMWRLQNQKAVVFGYIYSSWDCKQKPKRCDKVREKTEGSITWAYHIGKNPGNWKRVVEQTVNFESRVDDILETFRWKWWFYWKGKRKPTKGHLSIPVIGYEQWEQCIY